jgi:hypothetical protein
MSWAALLVTLLSGCAATGLTSTWVEPGRVPIVYRNILVFGVAANETVRRVYEETFVAALKERGVKAQAGHRLLPEGGLADERAVREVLALSGADAVLVTYLAGAPPGGTTPSPRTYVTPSLYGNLYAYYGLVYDNVTEPGYYARFTVLQLETNLYDAARERLVWSSRSAAMDPASEQTTISEVVAMVTQSLAQAGFLPR